MATFLVLLGFGIWIWDFVDLIDYWDILDWALESLILKFVIGLLCIAVASVIWRLEAIESTMKSASAKSEQTPNANKQMLPGNIELIIERVSEKTAKKTAEYIHTDNIAADPVQILKAGAIRDDGSWQCVCGRENMEVCSTCACGINRREIIDSQTGEYQVQ